MDIFKMCDGVDPSVMAGLMPTGHQKVMDDPHQIFFDSFNVTLDTVDNWNTPVNGGGGTAAANSPPLVVWPLGGVGNGTDKDITIPAGVANGLAIDDSGAAGAAGFSIAMEVTEE